MPVLEGPIYYYCDYTDLIKTNASFRNSFFILAFKTLLFKFSQRSTILQATKQASEN